MLLTLLTFLCLSTQALAVNVVTGGGLDSAEVMTVVRDSTTSTEIVDVDVASRDKYDVLMWTGSETIWAPYDTSLVFVIATFVDNQSNSATIGPDVGTWLGIGDASFTATYNNGPPVSCKVAVSGTGITPWDSLEMTSSCEGPTTNTQALDYPTKSGSSVTVTFTLNAATAAESDQETESVIFANWIYYGNDDVGSSFADGDIHTLDSTRSTDHTQTWNINAGVGEYVVFAYPTTLTQLDGGDDYEDDGDSDFRWNGFTCAMLDAHEVVSVENDKGYSENFDVWASTVTNLGNDQLTTYTSGGTINWIHYGITTETDSSAWDAGDIHAADDSTINNNEVGTWPITAGPGEYVMFAWPVRVDADDDLEFKIGALPGGFRTTQTISVTNSNGWTEDYRMTIAQNANLCPSGCNMTTGRGL